MIGAIQAQEVVKQLHGLETLAGQLLQAACDRGAERLWLAVGGSATVDGGVGAAMALGWSFRDRAGNSIGHGGAELATCLSAGRAGVERHADPGCTRSAP